MYCTQYNVCEIITYHAWPRSFHGIQLLTNKFFFFFLKFVEFVKTGEFVKNIVLLSDSSSMSN